jgi:hypothetical protein
MLKKQQNIELKKRYALEAVKWCKNYFGESDTKRRKLDFYISDKERKTGRFLFMGNYCFFRNRMVIYVNNCQDLRETVATVIHEYTHYLQSGPQYKRYEETHYYSTNPYEREAKRNEEKYAKICLKEIRNKLK